MIFGGRTSSSTKSSAWRSALLALRGANVPLPEALDECMAHLALVHILTTHEDEKEGKLLGDEEGDYQMLNITSGIYGINDMYAFSFNIHCRTIHKSVFISFMIHQFTTTQQ